jgi:hypothetical protein
VPNRIIELKYEVKIEKSLLKLFIMPLVFFSIFMHTSVALDTNAQIWDICDISTDESSEKGCSLLEEAITSYISSSFV